MVNLALIPPGPSSTPNAAPHSPAQQNTLLAGMPAGGRISTLVPGCVPGILVLFPGSRRRGRDDHWYAGAAVHTRQELVQRWGRRRNSRFYRVQPERIDEIRWVIPNVHVEIYSTVQFDGILTQEPSR